MSTVHVVLPGGVDDPAAPSGGNVYDRRVCHGLAAAGWSVHEHPVPGRWPYPTRIDRDRLVAVLARLPRGAVTLLDGLVAAAVPDVLSQASGLRLVTLVHSPFGDHDPGLRAAEGDGLAVAEAVITTSSWCRDRVVDRYGLPADRVHVAAPGVDRAPVASRSPDGGRLLCVAAVTRHKGHDILVEALQATADLQWRCVCVGSVTREADFADGLRGQASPLGPRLTFPGPRSGPALDRTYAEADLLVLASRAETYGMVVTEALARGIPVLAAEVGGLPEALGRAPDGTRPGMLIRAGDPAALAEALRNWLGDPGLRRRLRDAASARRRTLSGWAATTRAVAAVLAPLTVGARVSGRPGRA